MIQLAMGCAGATLVAWLAGTGEALALLAGAAVIAAAQGVFSWRTDLRPHSATAGRMFGRLLLGTALKWLVVGAGLVLAFTQGLVPAYVLAGALLAYLATFFSLPWLLR